MRPAHVTSSRGELLAGRLRQMPNAGTDNYCCGGDSEHAVINALFPIWQNYVAVRTKARQVLAAFADCLDPELAKY